MSTIRDVAEAAGVSMGTVSRFFHEPDRVHSETRARIQRAVEELGYAPNLLARRLRTGMTRVIRVFSSALGDPFYGAVLEALMRAAETKGYSVHVQQESAPLTHAFLNDIIKSRQADGILILGTALPVDLGGMDDAGTRLPIVICGETSDPGLQAFPRFQVDGFRAMEEITAHLIGLGHRRIGYIGGAEGKIEVPEREAGFRAALRAAGLAVDNSIILSNALTLAGGQRAAREMRLIPTLPTAIVCASDAMAFGAMAELRDAGVTVPDDVSVTGFDDTPHAALWNPPLTTIAQSPGKMGERAMEALMAAIRGGAPSATAELLPYGLVIRRSTTPPRHDPRVPASAIEAEL